MRHSIKLNCWDYPHSKQQTASFNLNFKFVISMRTIKIFTFFYVPLLSSLLVRADKHKGPWDDEVNDRVEDKTCECGIYDPAKNERPWTVFISRKGEKGPKLLCSGTIITSNLLATTHDCLKLPGNGFGMFNQSDLIISKDPGSATSPFKVTRVITNHGSPSKGAPIDDLVLIDVDPEFRAVSKDFSPICIPQCTDTPVNDASGQSPYFLGLLDTYPGRGWNFATSCSEGPDYTTTPRPGPGPSPGPSPPPPPPGPGSPPSPPPEGSESPPPTSSDQCSGGEKPSLCFQHGAVNPPKRADGVLVLDSASNDHRAFLVGVAGSRDVPSEKTADDEVTQYIHFHQISGLIRYIEYHADQVGSRWCHSGKLALMKPAKPIPAGPEGRMAPRKSWPWEDPQVNIPPRLEILDCVCGIKNEDRTGKIIGGEEAQPHEFPWMTFVINIKTFSRCTGQIINDRIVMTAAHCLQGVKDPADMVVYVNAHSSKNPKVDYPTTQRRVVKRFFNHPKYVNGQEGIDVTPHAVDISLLELDFPIRFAKCGKGLRPICLPPPLPFNLKLEGRHAEIAGWGGTRFPDKQHPNSEATDNLKKAVIKIQNEEICKKLQQNRELCTGNESQIENAYKGDSGGPLMLKMDGGKQYMLVGAVNSGNPFATNGVGPGITHYVWYAPVQKHLRFIDFVSSAIAGSFQTADLAKKAARWCKSSI